MTDGSWCDYANEAHGVKVGREYVALPADMVDALRQSGNHADDWDRIFVPVDAGHECLALTSRLIRSCDFLGTVYLNGFYRTSTVIVDAAPYYPGLSHSTFSGECFIDINCHIAYSRCHNCVVRAEAIISYCPHVIGSGHTTYGNQQVINIGPENGGRGVAISIGCSFQSTCVAALHHLPPPPSLSADYSHTIIGSGAVLSRCNEVVDCLIGDGCIVKMSTLRSCSLWFIKERVSCAVRSNLSHCLLDAGCGAEGCFAEHSLLLDHASLGERARVSHSVLGPDSSVAGGECLHSIIGPFVGFHHQSLLIASIWPMGRGNIAFGAMVGANHTGRLNDQECFPGEGCFFGLGCSIKFPFNAVQSPYSIIAPGTSCPAQKICFPFSLISSPELPASGLTSIKPAWVLRYNPYFLDRSAAKFAQRSKAKSHSTGFDIFRPSIVNLMIEANQRLDIGHVKSQYTESDIRGLGKCVLMERDRTLARQLYSDYIKRYALMGLLVFLERKEQDSRRTSWIPLELESSPKKMLEADLKLFSGDVVDIFPHQCSVLMHEYKDLVLDTSDIYAWPLRRMMSDLLELEGKHYEGVRCSRAKDERGVEIIEDYMEVHVSADEDGVVKTAKTRLETMRTRVEQLDLQ